MAQDVRLNRGAQIQIPGIKFIVENASTSRKKAGGVCIGIPPNWQCERLLTGIPEEITIKVEDTRKNVFILSTLYNRPKNHIRNEYLDHLRELSEIFPNVPKLIEGDLNSPHPVFGSRNSSSSGRKLVKWLTESDYKSVKMDSPTYISHSRSKAQNVLDIILHDEKMETLINDIKQCPNVGSDHIFYRISIKQGRFTGKKEKIIIHRDTQYQETERMMGNLVKLKDNPSEQELENRAEEITRIMELARNNSIKKKNVRHRDGIELGVESNELLREMRKLTRKRVRQDDEITRKELNRVKKELRYSIKRDEAMFHVKRIRRAGEEKNARRKWQVINEISEKDRRDGEPLCYIMDPDTGRMTKTTKETLEVHATRLQKSCSVPMEPWMDNELMRIVDESIENERDSFWPLKERKEEFRDSDLTRFAPDSEKLRKDINGLKSHAAPGPDRITNLDIKNTGPVWRFYICELFEKCLLMGYFPRTYKLALVKMLLKPGKPTNESKSYRPISLTSCLGKLLETYIGRSMDFVLDKYNMKLDRQAGFEKGRGTNECIFKLVEDAQYSNKVNGCTVAVMLDCQRAFDAVWHNGLRRKLKDYGLPPKLTRILSSFLRDRKMQVKEGEISSREFPISAGVPQGGLNSPRLFKFFITDIPIPRDQRENGSAYADDLVSWGWGYTTRQACESVQKFLDGFEYFCSKWRILPEPQKSYAINITSNPHLKKEKVKLSLLNQEIKQVKHVTYLGCEIDENLTWARNTDRMIQKAVPAIYTIKKLVNPLGKKLPHIIHECMDYLFTSIFAYAVPVFANMSSSQWKKIEILQRKMIRTIYGLPPKIENEVLHQVTGERPIKDLLCKQATKRIKKILNNMPGASNYLKRYRDFDHVRKYKGILEYYMEDKHSNFVNHYDCELCCFDLEHACVFDDPRRHGDLQLNNNA